MGRFLTVATKDLKVGHQFPTRTKVMTQERITHFAHMLPSSRNESGERESGHINIHTDLDYAKSKGLPATTADGLISTAWISAMMMDLFGEGYLRGGKLATTYLKPVYSDDKLTLKMVIKEKLKEDSTVRFNMDVSIENQRGEVVVGGTASALVW